MSDLSPNNELAITCAADDRFSLPLAVMLYSALKHLPKHRTAAVYLLDAGIASVNEHKIRSVIHPFGAILHWLRPDNARLAGLRISRTFPVSSWYRLLIPDLLPERVSRVLYLDCDILVEADLSILWDTDIGNNLLLAALSSLKMIKNSRIVLSPELSDQGHKPYLNSGVLLFNLNEARGYEFCRRAIAFGRRYPQLIEWQDQDCINAVAVDRWGMLDSRWNHLVRDRDGNSFRYRERSVLHFLGPDKPWLRAKSRHRETTDTGFAHRRYHQYLRESGWFG